VTFTGSIPVLTTKLKKLKIMNTIKILKKLTDKLEDLKDRPSDAFMNGYNNGLDQAILLLEEKIKQIEEVDE
jgi:hypothetical protein